MPPVCSWFRGMVVRAGALVGACRRARNLVCAAAYAATLSGAGLALAAVACSASRPAPQLATGERPVTGDARYDRFFGEVNDTFVAVREAKRDQADVRPALARRAGLPEGAEYDVLGARLRERTTRL